MVFRLLSHQFYIGPRVFESGRLLFFQTFISKIQTRIVSDRGVDLMVFRPGNGVITVARQRFLGNDFWEMVSG